MARRIAADAGVDACIPSRCLTPPCLTPPDLLSRNLAVFALPGNNVEQGALAQVRRLRAGRPVRRRPDPLPRSLRRREPLPVRHPPRSSFARRTLREGYVAVRDPNTGVVKEVLKTIIETIRVQYAG